MFRCLAKFCSKNFFTDTFSWSRASKLLVSFPDPTSREEKGFGDYVPFSWLC